MAFALRHHPWQFGLDLDPEGWTSIDKVVEALRLRRPDWLLLDWPAIEAAIRGFGRFEVRYGRIRATYGHSIALGKAPDVADPPAILFHGTSLDAVPSILQQGLSRKNRRFVHLSSDIDWVIDFLSDKPEWVIFAIRTDDALQAGIEFRKANFHVWLAERIEPRFLAIHLPNVNDAEFRRSVKHVSVLRKA